MSLEQTIRDTVVSESMDLDSRLQQLVRAGLMPQNTLPLLRKAIAKVQMGMSLQGAERDVMATFINSMMYIVLGDDTIFNKARAGAKTYAAEAKDESEYGYEGDMAINQLNTVTRHAKYLIDMMKPDTDLPEWVQAKITLATDYLQTACDYMTSEMKEAVGDYTVKTISPADAWKKHTGQKTSKSKVPVDPKTGKTLYQKVTSEEVEELDELSRATVGRYAKRAKDEADYGNPLKSRAKGREMASRKRWGGTSSYVKPARVPATEEAEIQERDEGKPGKMFAKIAAKAAKKYGSKEAGNRVAGAIRKKVLAKEDIEAVKKLNESYKTAFDAALEQYNIKSPSELDEEKRKEFFNLVDQEYKKGDK